MNTGCYKYCLNIMVYQWYIHRVGPSLYIYIHIYMYYRVCSSQSGNRYESQIVSTTSGVDCLLNKSWLVMEMHRAGHSLYRYRVGSSQSGNSYESQIVSNTSGVGWLLTQIGLVMEVGKWNDQKSSSSTTTFSILLYIDNDMSLLSKLLISSL